MGGPIIGGPNPWAPNSGNWEAPPGTLGSWDPPTGPPLAGAFGPPLQAPVQHSLSELHPPGLTVPNPGTRPKPPGCKTVFIGGLPATATVQVVEDVFEQFGEIHSVRMAKGKNFCHVRYMGEGSVDQALAMSGWRMRVGGLTDDRNTGRLHVDFAQVSGLEQSIYSLL